jgi:hypothetical protein
MSAAMAGGVIAFYQLGYGIAAFGVGPIIDGGVSLSTVYGVSAGIAGAMGALSVVVAGRPAGKSASVDGPSAVEQAPVEPR